MNRSLALHLLQGKYQYAELLVFSYPQGKKKITTQETGSVQLCNVADNHHLSMKNALNSPAVQPQLSSNYFNMLFGQFWKESNKALKVTLLILTRGQKYSSVGPNLKHL